MLSSRISQGHITAVVIALLTAFVAVTAPAGTTITSDSKNEPVVEVPTAAPVVSESRGLVTLEGPSGMFLNPTSATLPQGVFAIGFCSVLTNQDTDILGYHMFMSYGVRDWLELGVVASMNHFSQFNLDENLPDGDYGYAGPMARVRLHRDVGGFPEVSVGGYGKFGTDKFDSQNLFIAASKTFPIDEKGFLKTVTFQGGFRESWLEAPDRNTNRFYGGIEVQFPCNIWAVAEVTQFASRKDEFQPWAVGLQWRGKKFGLSAAVVQSGDDDPPSIYLGIGTGLGAEPVRIPTRPVRP